MHSIDRVTLAKRGVWWLALVWITACGDRIVVGTVMSSTTGTAPPTVVSSNSPPDGTSIETDTEAIGSSETATDAGAAMDSSATSSTEDNDDESEDEHDIETELHPDEHVENEEFEHGDGSDGEGSEMESVE